MLYIINITLKYGMISRAKNKEGDKEQTDRGLKGEGKL